MNGPSGLVPRTKIREIPPGTKMRLEADKYKVELVKTVDMTVLTIEYVTEKGGWGIIKLIDPDPNLSLNDLVLSAQVFLSGTISPNAPEALT
jgi:hypothetical protein